MQWLFAIAPIDLTYITSLLLKSQTVQLKSSFIIQIDCWNSSQVFKAGHRIGLEISSSAFPKYDRNLNTGAPLGVTTEMAVAEQRVYHDEGHPSAIVLPIVSES